MGRTAGVPFKFLFYLHKEQEDDADGMLKNDITDEGVLQINHASQLCGKHTQQLKTPCASSVVHATQKWQIHLFGAQCREAHFFMPPSTSPCTCDVRTE